MAAEGRETAGRKFQGVPEVGKEKLFVKSQTHKDTGTLEAEDTLKRPMPTKDELGWNAFKILTSICKVYPTPFTGLWGLNVVSSELRQNL